MEKELLEACEDGDVEEVRRLLKNINGKDFDIETPLYIACENGHTDVVKLLLSDKRIGIKKANKNEEVKVDDLTSDLSVSSSNPSVFLTHTWVKDELNRDNHARVGTVNKLLKAQGFQTWFDEDKMVGHIDIPMAQGIDDSDVILVFITKVYMEKVASQRPDNCKAEFTYATNRNKKMIPIVMEPSMRDTKQWNGPIGLRLSGDLYVDMSETGSEKDISALVQHLKKTWSGSNLNLNLKLKLNDTRTDINKGNTSNKDESETSFFIACENGHMDIVKLLLNDKRIDINTVNKKDQTPFYIACENGHIEIIELLLNDKRVDKTQTQNDYWATFWMACYSGQIKVVGSLLNDERIDINKSNLWNETPFYVTCQQGQIEIVKLLLNDKRVDINKANKNEATPFSVACEKGYIEIVELLLNDKRVDINKPNDSGNTPLYIVCENGYIDIAKLLLNDKRIDKTQTQNDYWATFWIACYSGQIKVVESLLNDERIDINKTNRRNKTPFFIACENGHIEIVELLLNDENVITDKADDNDQTPFWIACEKGDVSIVKLLLNDERVDLNKVNKDETTPFWIACENGHIEIVELLLNDNSVDINKGNKNDATPFYIACGKGYIEIVKLLLNDNRVDINSETNNGGFTPFYIACDNGHIEIVKLLLNDNRVNVNKARNDDGQTPFYIACGNGHIEIVKLLLNDQRIDLNKPESQGGTPFYIACQNGHLEIVKLLLNDKRVGINTEKNSGETPFYIACEKGKIEVVKSLLNDKRISIKKRTKFGKIAIEIAKEKKHSNIVKLMKEFDTEQRYREYLEIFQSLIHIESESINKRDFLVLNEHLKNNNNVKELRLINCELTSSNTLEILKTLIWKYENLQLSNLQNIEIDDIKLESAEGLETIPIEIRNQGTKSIVQYILDLCKSPNSKPLYRTKLMVVGFENVGKTTILDCLFPIQDLGKTKKMFQKMEYIIELQGKFLRKYKPKEPNRVYKVIILVNKQWNIQEIKEIGLALIPLNDKSQKKIEIHFKDQQTRDKWSERLKRVIRNVATHGIEIQDQILQNPNKLNIANELAESLHSSNEQNLETDIDVSIWDFAGQHDYYNNHHYFLSTRTVFLVLWKMKDGKNGTNGLEGLNFWFKSLSSHLQHDLTLTNGKPYFSIIVVGTFLDDQSINKSEESKKLREQKILEIARSNGIDYPIQIYEVSCSTMENIKKLKQDIYKQQ